VLGHAALLAVLLYRAPSGDIVKPPERIEVTISDEVGLVSSSPEPQAASQGAVAPTLGEPAPAELIENLPLPVPVPLPAPVATPITRPAPAPRAAPAPAPRAAPAPTRRTAPAPTRRTTTTPRRSAPAADPMADLISGSSSSSSSSSSTRRSSSSSSRPSGASRVGSDFLDGSRSASASGTSSSQAAAITGRVRSALSSQISRELKPHWAAPEGPEVEKIVTVLSWSLNKDGSLSGTPRVVRQTGVNSVNSAQASRHAEQAIRAVQLAAPFDLPAEYYEGWKRITSFNFDRRLSQ
jgi:outer membrane biosynthesis protein TonB